jgi:hypothetical protein
VWRNRWSFCRIWVRNFVLNPVYCRFNAGCITKFSPKGSTLRLSRARTFSLPVLIESIPTLLGIVTVLYTVSIKIARSAGVSSQAFYISVFERNVMEFARYFKLSGKGIVWIPKIRVVGKLVDTRWLVSAVNEVGESTIYRLVHTLLAIGQRCVQSAKCGATVSASSSSLFFRTSTSGYRNWHTFIKIYIYIHTHI